MTIKDYFFNVLSETQTKLVQYRETIVNIKNKEYYEQHKKVCEDIVEAATNSVANAVNREDDKQLCIIKTAITALLNVQDEISTRLNYLREE